MGKSNIIEKHIIKCLLDFIIKYPFVFNEIKEIRRLFNDYKG